MSLLFLTLVCVLGHGHAFEFGKQFGIHGNADISPQMVQQIIGGMEQGKPGKITFPSSSFPSTVTFVVESQYLYGLMKYYGHGVPQDQAGALSSFRKSAAQGYLEAEFTMGVLLYYGEGVASDGHAASAYLTQCAEKGHSDAQWLLGTSVIVI